MASRESRTSLAELWHRRLPELYAAVAMAVTFLLCFIVAPFFGPDEPNQSCRALSISHGQLAIPPLADEAGAQIDVNARGVMDAVDQLRMTWEKTASDFHDRPYGPLAGPQREGVQRQLAQIRWARRSSFAAFANTALYPPPFYLPAVVGWRTGEVLDLTVIGSLHLARLLCALTAVGLGWLALRIGTAWRWMLLPFLLLPSTLFLNATCSQDAVMLSAAALIAAVVARALSEQRRFTNLELAAVAVLAALCGTARPPNAAMALVLFLPELELPSAEPHANWWRWRSPAVAFAGVAAACASWRLLISGLGLDTSDQADPALQMVFLRTHPLAAASAVLRGTAEAAADFFQRGLYVIGWNDLLPRPFHHVTAAAVLVPCLVAIAICSPGASQARILKLSWRGSLLLAIAVAAPLLGISLAEYIIWTPPGWSTVYGIQPRYWLPMLPLALLLVSGTVAGLSPAPRLNSRARNSVRLTATLVLIVVACTLPEMAADAFYREGVAHVLRLNLER